MCKTCPHPLRNTFKGYILSFGEDASGKNTYVYQIIDIPKIIACIILKRDFYQDVYAILNRI